MNNLIFYSHGDCLLKDNGINHPERKERLNTIIKSINQIDDLVVIKKEAPIADLQEISLVHPINYIENMFSKIPTGGLGNDRRRALCRYFFMSK